MRRVLIALAATAAFSAVAAPALAAPPVGVSTGGNGSCVFVNDVDLCVSHP